MWWKAAEDGGTGWIARSGGAIGVPEQDTACGESIQVRRERLRMPTQAADPIVQVVDGDE